MKQTSFSRKMLKNQTAKSTFQIAELNLKLNVQYGENVLRFNWNLMDIPISNTSFIRHIIIFDIDPKDSEIFREFQIIKKIYKYAKLGDFIRIFNTCGQINSTWIQKTSQDIQRDQFILKKKGDKDLLYYLQKAFQKSSKINQPVSILLFTKNCNVLKANIMQKLYGLKQKYMFHFIFNLFFLEFKGQANLPKEIPFILYQSYSPERIAQGINEYFYNLTKIRARSAQLKLFCHGKQLQIYDAKNSSWIIQDEYMVKKLYMLNNYTIYTEKIYITSIHTQKLCFEIRFTINLIQNIKFQMNHTFYINVKNNLKKIQEIQKKQFKKINDYRFFSQMTRGNGIVYTTFGQRIMIRQLFSQPLCQYQKLIK